jgi:Tol biopolymer transport system component
MWMVGMTKRLLVAIASVLALAFVAATPAHALTPGPNGKIVFVSDRAGNDEIYIMKADGTGLTRLTNNAADDRYPALSPDGTKIAFVSSRSTPSYEIYTMKVDGTNVTRLTNNAFHDFHPAWSPDGAKIAFDTDRDGNTEIYTMNADGTAQTNRTSNAGFDQDPDWSPDGTKIAFSSYRAGNFDVFTMNADGTGSANRTNNPAADEQPGWSPDSAKLVFVSYRDATPAEIYTMNADGTSVTRLTNNVFGDWFPTWSPDGTKVLFTSGRDGEEELYLMNADGTAQTNRTNDPELDGEQSWGALRPSFDVPRAASRITVSLVPFFRQTISTTQCASRGGAVSTHGAPLSLTSCNPPGFSPGTQAHFGSQAAGTIQGLVVPGDLMTAADEADVTITTNLTDIRAASKTGADYDPNPGGADASLIFKLRLSDTYNGGSLTDPATSDDYDFSTPVTCTATGGSQGSTCAVASSADSVMPGVVREGASMVLQVYGLRIFDSGPNGVRSDADDRMFAFQGVYVP